MVGGYGIPAVAIANSYISVANGYGKNAVASYYLFSAQFTLLIPTFSLSQMSRTELARVMPWRENEG